MTDVDELERRVLAAMVANEQADPEGAWACNHPSIVEAAENAHFADQVCRMLRKRKLLDGHGRGAQAHYYPTEKGRAKAAKEATP